MNPSKFSVGTGALVFGLCMAFSPAAQAHCDTMEGPVVKAGQEALRSNNVAPALIWVQPQSETEIKRAFKKASSVRKLGAEARELADTWFFETLVRIHRAGEGEPYTGLKSDRPDPAIAAVDEALQSRSEAPLKKALGPKFDDEIATRFRRALALQKYEATDVAAGREFVKAYVELTHAIEKGEHRH